MARKDLKYLLDMALETAKYAAKTLLCNASEARKVRWEGQHDIKIKADKAVEKVIIKCLKSNSDYPIFSEERGEVKGKDESTGYCWVVDPLDGSLNFLRGIPNSCISIALWMHNDPMLGVVFDFNRDEAFTALIGKGAWLNRREIRVSKLVDKSKGVLCTGFPSDGDFSDRGLKRFFGEVKKFKKVRLLGSAALSLAYVASGRADFYYENGIKFWDVAAGLCLVKAAGGIINYKKVYGENAFNVSAANTRLL